jgi:hypothetical protein
MTHHWDEFSKSLAEPLPRRESLRRLGVVLTGAVLSPLGLDTALAGKPDPCKAFCNRCPKSQRSRCLTACSACNSDTRRLCGSCGTYVCCASGRTCCGGYVCCGSGRTCCSGYCTDLSDDVLNCGACGFVCDPPGPYEYGACIDGGCTYVCADGAIDCDGNCTFVGSDPNNCGACGNVCPASAPACVSGACSECPVFTTNCGGYCAYLHADPNNCGACGNICPASAPVCLDGMCSGCLNPLQTNCGGYCTYLQSDPRNCGACGFVCVTNYCTDGVCDSGPPPSDW